MNKEMKMRLNEFLQNDEFGKPTHTAEEIANKFGLPVDVIQQELSMGIKVEQEHTDSVRIAMEIALDHLNEIPNYYSKLNKMEKE